MADPSCQSARLVGRHAQPDVIGSHLVQRLRLVGAAVLGALPPRPRRPVDQRVLRVVRRVLRRHRPASARRRVGVTRPVHRQLAAGGAGATGGEETGQQRAELLTEVVVHPRVQERVVDGAAHGDDVCNEEDEQEVEPLEHRRLVLLRDVHDVERQPAADEDRHHRDQHPVGAPLPPDLQLLARATLGARPDLVAHAHVQRDRHLRVAEGDDAARHDVLQDEAGDGEELARRDLRPVLVTHVGAVRRHPLDLLVDRQRQRDRHRDHPYGGDQQQTHGGLHARLERVDDDEVAVDGDGGRRERRYVDGHAERHRHHVTEHVAEDPRVEEGGQRREGDGEQAHHDVGDGQVGDEDVGDGLDRLVLRDHVDDEHVAGNAEHEDDAVEEDEGAAQPRVVHQVGRLQCRGRVRRRVDEVGGRQGRVGRRQVGGRQGRVGRRRRRRRRRRGVL